MSGVVWGAGHNRRNGHTPKRHAFSLDGPADLAETSAEYRRSYQLRAVCGTAWSDLEPLPGGGLLDCRTCARLAPEVVS